MPLLCLLFLAQAWRRVDLEGILVALPAAPRRVYPPGAPPSVRNWVTTSGNDGVGISLQPFDSAKPADISLSDDLDGFMSGYGGRIVAQADVALNGWPGIDATLRSPRLGDVRFVAYRTEKGLVTVTAGGTSPGSAAFGKRVVESIRLSDPFGQGPRKTAGPDWTRTLLKPSPFAAEFPRKPQGGRAMASPASPFQPRTWMARYGNRRYIATLVTPLEKPPAPSSAESRWKSIRNVNDGALKSARAKLVARNESTFLGERSERIEGGTTDGATAVLSEATVKDEQTIVALAIVPRALRSSPEVARFFRSFKKAVEKQ